MPLSRACPAVAERFFAPLEFGSQVVVLEFLLGDDVAEFGARDVNDSVLHLKDVIGIVVQPFALEECVEAVEVVAIKEDDRRAMRGNIFRCWPRNR